MADHIVRVVDGSSEFIPNVASIKQGDTIVWKWEGPGLHSVTFDNLKLINPATAYALPEEDTGLKGDGFEYKKTFDHLGKFMYHCSLKGMVGNVGMAGIVKVGEDQAEELKPEDPSKKKDENKDK